MIKIEKSKFSVFIQNLVGDFTVFAPVGEGRQSAFDEVADAESVNTALQNTVQSPKSIFFPQTEVLFTYNDGDVQIPEAADKPFFLWGVRACDARSIMLVDKVFGRAKQRPDDPAFEDPYWKAKLDTAVILTLACNEPASTCFCHWTGDGPFEQAGDLWAVDVGSSYLIESLTEKGKAVLERIENASPAGKTEAAEIDSLRTQAESYLGDLVDLSELKDRMKQMWDDPAWDDIAAKCVNCGACAYACPTCHCFDVQDEGKKGKGQRIRLWDACMFPLFTKEASGHNPRGQAADRVRQRFLHKFSYYWDNYGESLCTGCGRCIYVCPVNLDIRTVVKRFLDIDAAV